MSANSENDETKTPKDASKLTDTWAVSSIDLNMLQILRIANCRFGRVTCIKTNMTIAAASRHAFINISSMAKTRIARNG